MCQHLGRRSAPRWATAHRLIRTLSAGRVLPPRHALPVGPPVDAGPTTFSLRGGRSPSHLPSSGVIRCKEPISGAHISSSVSGSSLHEWLHAAAPTPPSTGPLRPTIRGGLHRRRRETRPLPRLGARGTGGDRAGHSCAASFRDVWPGAPGRGQLAPLLERDPARAGVDGPASGRRSSGRPSSSGVYGGVGREDLRLTVSCQAVIAGSGSVGWSWLRVHPRREPVRPTPPSPGRGRS
jgi:hypothetical protein